MKENTAVLETLLERAQDWAKTSIQLIKLKTIDTTSDAVSSIISRIAASIFFLMFFLTGSIGLCIWLGEVLGKTWYGFFLVAGFYGLIALFLFFFLHKWFKTQISNFIIRQFLK